MDTQFQKIGEKDLPIVKEIYDWYILHTTATFHTEPISIEQLREFIYIDHTLYKSYLICGDNAQILGYCILTNYKKRQAYDRTAEISIYLKPECSNKGLGRQSLRFLEQKAREVGIKNLIASISGNNERSISLFEKAGFTKCAHFKNMGEKFNELLDVVIFQKEI